MAEEDKTTVAPAAQETAAETQASAPTKSATAPTEEKTVERRTSLAPNTTQVTARAKRRREEAVRRLVSDVQARPENRSSQAESQDWIVASTVAAALERGLDRDLHQELVQEAKENSGRIGQVCHDHSDVFLASVGKVVALGGPSADLANKLLSAQEELELKTAGPMITSAHLWETAKDSHSRATALYIMVNACQKVAMWLERARKQAALGRPRAALEAVDEARTALTAPMSSLFYGTSMEHAASYLKKATQKKELLMNTKANTSNPSNPQSDKDGTNNAAKNATLASLEETPFGRRAILMLPKIENEVLMGARRGLNRWFLALRSGGDGAKAGRAVLRKCAYSMAVGPGQLGLGGHVPPSYLWRSKVSDNLISRMNQNGRVVRAVRLGFWFERDGPKEAARLEQNTTPGMERRAEAFASAFGWYRCWDEHVSLMVDPSDYSSSDMGRAAGAAGLSGSRHGLGGSRHGAGAKGGRTLGFRASRQAQTNSMNIGLNSTALMGTKSTINGTEKSKWAALLTPAILFDNTPTR